MPVYKGWNAKIKISGQEVGYCTEVRVDIDHSLQEYFSAGSRQLSMILEGPLKIKGHFSRAWIDMTYLTLLNNTTELETFDLEINVSNSTLKLTLYDCKLDKGTVNVPQDGFLVEDYDFIATSFAVA